MPHRIGGLQGCKVVTFIEGLFLSSPKQFSPFRNQIFGAPLMMMMIIKEFLKSHNDLIWYKNPYSYNITLHHFHFYWVLSILMFRRETNCHTDSRDSNNPLYNQLSTIANSAAIWKYLKIGIKMDMLFGTDYYYTKFHQNWLRFCEVKSFKFFIFSII